MAAHIIEPARRYSLEHAAIPQARTLAGLPLSSFLAGRVAAVRHLAQYGLSPHSRLVGRQRPCRPMVTRFVGVPRPPVRY